MKVYLIGSLRNPQVPLVAARLRTEGGFDVFDDWYAAGPNADDHWKEYEQQRGNTYREALFGHAADHVFYYDKQHLDEADAAVLMLPAGRSGHLELGYAVGAGKLTYILLDAEDVRWDVMYRFAGIVVDTVENLIDNMEFDRAIKEEA